MGRKWNYYAENGNGKVGGGERRWHKIGMGGGEGEESYMLPLH